MNQPKNDVSSSNPLSYIHICYKTVNTVINQDIQLNMIISGSISISESHPDL